ncbi:Malate glyoxysomal [Micractinium conductrix]|uniref:malate dehydrogenase n=1 Tax=Micractinium conductrix TaxID=554055 RepID=A0A2P6VET7_9CHLO|nr:Malate glyoxysomal [Micractinium conductrix]|eukprot:PSC72606.1 Malate glyoxysomal [Micractinium conductrix]
MQRVARLAAHFSGGLQEPEEGLHAQNTSAPGDGYNVAVLGAAGGIGQPLSLLLKLSSRVRELRLYDVANTAGVAGDLSHISTAAHVTAHTGPQQLGDALYGAHLVVIPAGVPRKPGMTRDDLFNINAGIVRTLVEGVARYCPGAWLAVISNPVNSTVPIAAEVLKRAGVFNPARLFGVTSLDVVRAETFVAQALGVDPAGVHVPVIGGHAGITILPVLSAATPPLALPEERQRALMARIQDAGTEVVQAKAGAGSATLSMAHAAARFAEACLRAMSGEAGVVECAYVASSLTPQPYFASQLRLGPAGIAEFLPLPRLTPLERDNYERMQEELRTSIQKGLDFAARQ